VNYREKNLLKLSPGGAVGEQSFVGAVDEERDANVDAVGRRVAVLADGVPLLPHPDLLPVDEGDLADDRVLEPIL
jgi:hypothetical protein